MLLKRLIRILLIILIAVPFGCKKTSLNPQLFAIIQNEILDSDMQQTTKESIVAKYGISLSEYEEYEKKVESYPELKAQVGKERLNLLKKSD